jgi:octaprenyl-diphosphate synthase
MFRPVSKDMFSKIRQSISAREAFELVKDDLVQVEAEIGVESAASVETITTINQYLQAGGGKRLRPALLLLCNRLFGPSTDCARRLAAVVEMVHTATLVHDDVIDVAKSRRGRPASNVVWGNHISVLAGDWLYMQAFQLAMRERNFHILDVLISLTQMMVEGELLQLDRLRQIDTTEADYMELVDRKTARLFSACASLGAIAAGAEDSAEANLREFAWNLGMAFQLVDDILDFTSTEKILGKPAGNDLREGKVTLPMIYALEGCSEAERRMVETVMTDGSYEQVPFMQIVQILDRQSSIKRAYDRARHFTDRSRSILSTFPDGPAQRALNSILDLVTERTS